MEQTKENAQQEALPSPFWKWTGRLFRMLLMIIIIAGSVGISYYWLANRPVTERRPPRPEAVLVETTTLEAGSERVVIEAMGTVIPARQIQLAARVSGQIIDVHPQFVPGGRFQSGDVVLTIDPADYELAERQQAGNLTRAESEVRLEMGQQTVARHEYELLLDNVEDADFDLLLRKPQLAAKEAAVTIAQATLEKAQLDLERTRVRTPFNAVVQNRNTNLGAYLAPGTALATLVGTDVFWVEATVPVDDLIHIPFVNLENKEDILARVYHEAAWGPDTWRAGRVERLLSDLEPQGRMARVLIAVTQPLDGNAETGDVPPLLLGAFVRVAIEGAALDHVFKIPRTALREGDSVWIMDEDNTLDVRAVRLAWGTRDHVYIVEGVDTGEQLIQSDLATPVPGMSLRTDDMEVERDGRPGGGGGGDGGPQRRTS